MNLDQNLISTVTQQVLLALQNQSRSSTVGVPAKINPPAGICTAGSSKKSSSPAPVTSPAKKPCADPHKCTDCSDCKAVQNATVLHGVITAKQITAAKSTTIQLAKGAILTPLARDLIKEKKITISSAITKSATSTKSNVYTWWADGQSVASRQTTSNLTTLSAPNNPASLISALKQIDADLKQNKIAGAVLLVNSAARAACFANRIASIRAVVGTSLNSITQGVEQLAANVLIVEYSNIGAHAISDMISTFTTQPRPDVTRIEQQLQEVAL